MARIPVKNTYFLSNFLSIFFRRRGKHENVSKQGPTKAGELREGAPNPVHDTNPRGDQGGDRRDEPSRSRAAPGWALEL